MSQHLPKQINDMLDLLKKQKDIEQEIAKKDKGQVLDSSQMNLLLANKSEFLDQAIHPNGGMVIRGENGALITIFSEISNLTCNLRYGGTSLEFRGQAMYEWLKFSLENNKLQSSTKQPCDIYAACNIEDVKKLSLIDLFIENLALRHGAAGCKYTFIGNAATFRAFHDMEYLKVIPTWYTQKYHS